jgi:putative PIN family toxin of toxin-antitoxin system
VIVCFDTNVWISAVATRGLCADVVSAALAEHQIVVGKTVLAELRRVLREKLRAPKSTIDELDGFLRLHARIVTAARPVDLPRLDLQDRMVLAEAVLGRADVLVTGDQAVLRVGGNTGIKVLSPRGFWELLRSG